MLKFLRSKRQWMISENSKAESTGGGRRSAFVPWQNRVKTLPIGAHWG